MLISQALSLNVMSAPVPALFPENCSILLRKSGEWSVVVKESQLLSSTRV